MWLWNWGVQCVCVCVCVCVRARLHVCVCVCVLVSFIAYFTDFLRTFFVQLWWLSYLYFLMFQVLLCFTAATGTVKLHCFDPLAQGYITRLNKSSHFLGQWSRFCFCLLVSLRMSYVPCIYLYLLVCPVRVTVLDSGLCCCVCVTSFKL